MLVFKMKKNGVPYQMELHLYTGKETTPLEIREYANQLWTAYLSDPAVTELMAIGPDNTVRMPPEDKPFAWGVWARFSNSPNAKMYPFVCNKELKAGTRFLVMPYGRPTIATVVKCSWTSKTKILTECNKKRLYHITNIITAV